MIQTSFLSQSDQCSGARSVAVLTDRYASIRPDIVVELPVLCDRFRGSLHATVGVYEKVWIDPVFAIVERHDIDYSSGLASCLDQSFDVIQDYLGGSEIWFGSFQADFANGEAVCLWHTFEVVQSYLGGSESWTSSHQFDFALGRAVCLWHTFEVIQSYLGGVEAWASSHQVDFALGRAVCLWQNFEVVQSYLGGAEAWASSHQVDFALGRADCLWQSFEVIQGYLGGSESWTSSQEQFFALGRSVCLFQNYQIDQPYVGGNEGWSSLYESFFSTGQSNGLLQGFDVIQPYMSGREDWTFRYDIASPSVTSQMFLVGTENTEIAALGVSVCGGYEIKSPWSTEATFAYDSIREDRYFAVLSSHDDCWLYHFLATAATGEVFIDVLNGQPRLVDAVSIFNVPECSRIEISDRYDFTEYASVRLCSDYEIISPGRFLLWLQEEAYFVFTVCLTNLHAGQVTTVVTTNLEECISTLAGQCTGEAQWQMEYETTARFYNPDRPDQSRDSVLWRFVTKDEKHWKQEPVVSDVRAVKLPSFMELHFSADWPYRSLELQINACQFQPTQDGDWFDLGVWISDSARIDTDERPLLTIPYTSETTNYDVHVPRQETTRYIGIAPIRRFPYEEIGALSVIFVP